MLRHAIISGAIGLFLILLLLTLPGDIALPLVLLAPAGVGFFAASVARVNGLARSRVDAALAGSMAAAVLALLGFVAVTVLQPVIGGVRGGTVWSLVGLMIVIGAPGVVGAMVGGLLACRRMTVYVGAAGSLFVLAALLLSSIIGEESLVNALYLPPLPAAVFTAWHLRNGDGSRVLAFREGVFAGVIAGSVSVGVVVGNAIAYSTASGRVLAVTGGAISRVYLLFTLEALLLAALCLIPAALGLRLAERRMAS